MNPSKYETWAELAERRKTHAEIEDRLHAAFGPLPEPAFRYELTISPCNSRLIIFDIEDLTAARALLRAAFGSWHDKLEQRFYSGAAITVWESTEGWPCALWFQCKVEDYPESLKSDKCKWVEHGKESKDYSFACDISGE